MMIFGVIVIYGLFIASIIAFIVLHFWQKRLRPPAVTSACPPDQIPNTPPPDRTYETMYAYDSEGEMLFCATQYDSKTVRFSPEQEDYLVSHPGCVTMHNHVEDIPPSLNDLVYANQMKLDFFVVMSPNFAYLVMPGRSGWQSVEALGRAATKHLDLFRIVAANNTVTDNRFNDDGRFMFYADIDITSTDEAIAAITNQLGYTYRKEPLLPRSF